MNPEISWTGTSLLCVLASAVSVLSHPSLPQHRSPAEARTLALECAQTPHPRGGSVLRLHNTSGLRLPAQQAVVWSSRGTPGPTGELLRLPQELPPGQDFRWRSRWPAQGGGCLAVAYRE
ncbi:hypothetical protein BurJ1DRAFT_0768 [Burkholderiales bacterium JOSHI_001]|nr:hypothetical protein BurJ1DRAFT_0768 [Burkholderiales bacterium JOSHI_001]